MRDRFFTGTLILLVLFGCGILFKADSQAQWTLPKFHVCVKVTSDDENTKTLIESYINRELRSLGDVKVVTSMDTSHFLKVVAAERDSHWHKTGSVAIAVCFYRYSNIPEFYIKPDLLEMWQDLYISSMYTEPRVLSLLYPKKDLRRACEYITAIMDQEKFEPMRKIFNR